MIGTWGIAMLASINAMSAIGVIRVVAKRKENLSRGYILIDCMIAAAVEAVCGAAIVFCFYGITRWFGG